MRLFALLAACSPENELAKQGEENDVPTGDSDFQLDSDSGGTTQDSDSGTISTSPEACADWDGSAAAGSLPARDSCEAPPEVEPSWELTPLWEVNSVDVMYGGLTAVANLTDDNGDGRVDTNDDVDVVYAPWMGNVVALDGATGDLLWDSGSSGLEQGIPAIGDLDADGFPEVVITSLYWTRVYNGEDGSLVWDGYGPTGSKTECGGPGIADLDADGVPEVFHGRQIYDSTTGEVIAEGKYGYGTGFVAESPSSIAGDIDLDGDQEVVVGNSAYDKDGDSLFYTGEADGFPALADFDDDPEAEIVSVGQEYVRLFDHDGEELWSTANGSTLSTPSPPAVADFDGDGEPEIGYIFAGNPVMLDGDGSVLWTATGHAVVWVNEVAAADLDNDGIYEFLVGNADGLSIYDGPTGTTLANYPTNSSMCGPNPVFADLDGDGAGEILVAGPGVGVLALTDPGGFSAARSIWNEGGYSITNVGDDGSIPASPEMNWDVGYNSFRASPPAEAVVGGPNLVGEIVGFCAEACGEGRLELSYRLGNDGVVDFSGSVAVEIWGATGSADALLWSGSWTEPLAIGVLGAAQTLSLEGVPDTLYDIWLRIDPEQDLNECDEGDNDVHWGDIVCDD